ncbi:acyltransferase family protein [Streptomyces ferrugineus]|uniref:Acyltransferase family protein n=1 Tax=Streptomyces ferrugineus TaxID=1413221 RepID=A0A7M2SC53_9ACTN|nr:acyltransferase family protein [Streptomyces ferrugineus]QOV33579.1 acyltransferase family protein [Streptomyces ferrugineus]
MSAQTQVPATAPRRGELDTLRVLVVLGLVFFHSALVFSPDDDFYVKNAETTGAVTVLAGFGVVWAMPMLFLVAGLGSRHSIRRRGAARFTRERLLRLGVPLVVATVVLCPLPQWLRLRAADPGYDESYGRFWLRFLTVHPDLADFPFVLDGEHFETGHLWFVVLLLTFSLLLAPVAAPLAAWSQRAGQAVQRRPSLLLAPLVPLAAINAFLGMEEGFAGWNRWAYLVFFAFGYALADDVRVRAALRRLAVPVGVAGLVLFAGTAPGFLALDDPFTDGSAPALVTRAVFGAAGWCWVVAILGLLDRPREVRAPSRAMVYLGIAALPVYVLHQPVVVALAYGVAGWPAPIAVEYAVIVAGSLIVILALYEGVVRRTRWTRFLFGMRPAPPKALSP